MLFSFNFQFCCADGVFHALTVRVLSADGHLDCSVPHYVFITCAMTFISVSVFLKLAAGVKLILMVVMGAGYAVVMEVTHRKIYDDFDNMHK